MNNEQSRNPVIVKVGGSLFDLQDLGPSLQAWLRTLSERAVVLVPGGGAFAGVIRQLDGRHDLGEEKSHWLALASMSLAAQFLVALLPHSVLAKNLVDCGDAWRRGLLPVLDPYQVILSEEAERIRLPHSWQVTSDSVAARIASLAGARQLILLKSVTLPEGLGWKEAGSRGYVDSYFAQLIDGSFNVRFINFRQEHA
jgi:5-(aminomethyl)-3-furanmethanol phosphate kinase